MICNPFVCTDNFPLMKVLASFAILDNALFKVISLVSSVLRANIMLARAAMGFHTPTVSDFLVVFFFDPNTKHNNTNATTRVRIVTTSIRIELLTTNYKN